MYPTQEASPFAYTSFANLPAYPPSADLNTVAEVIRQNFESRGNWKSIFDAIDNLRIINKYYPSQKTNIFVGFGGYILEQLENPKQTSVFRNTLFLMREVFEGGKTEKIDDQIVKRLLPVLMSKITNEKAVIREEIKSILNDVCTNCVYDSTFEIVCQCCFDKNTVVCETALKMLAKLVQTCNLNLFSLNPSTLQIIFRTMANLFDEKKCHLKNGNLKTWNLEICNFIYRLVGVENYLNFMNQLLTPEERTLMMSEMEKPLVKKESKKSRVSLGDYLKTKKMEGMMN
jgi:hypothetical protein